MGKAERIRRSKVEGDLMEKSPKRGRKRKVSPVATNKSPRTTFGKSNLRDGRRRFEEKDDNSENNNNVGVDVRKVIEPRVKSKVIKVKPATVTDDRSNTVAINTKNGLLVQVTQTETDENGEELDYEFEEDDLVNNSPESILKEDLIDTVKTPVQEGQIVEDLGELRNRRNSSQSEVTFPNMSRNSDSEVQNSLIRLL